MLEVSPGSDVTTVAHAVPLAPAQEAARSRRSTRGPRLTLDVGPLLDNQWTGIPVFTRRLAEALLRDGRVDLSFSFNLARLTNSKVVAAIKAGTGTFLRHEYEDYAYADCQPVDPGEPILYPSVKRACSAGAREASVIHDMSTLVMPENHEASNVSHHLDDFVNEVRSNEMTFCVSEATKYALETYFPSLSGRTTLLYQYVDWPPEFSIMDRNLPDLKIGRYAVVIGTIEPRKNLAILLRALALPELDRSDLTFVIIGKLGWLVDTFLNELTPAQKSRLVFSGFVSEFMKYRLIAHAEFMVFPSLYEGFGIPAVEALSLGKPVLASRTSSFPEVIGKAGLYFDPVSAEELADCLTRMSHEPTLAGLASEAVEQSRQFNWRRMADPVVRWATRL
jgi:glycosyltransferase involved in cell wall biosynthesis